MKSNSWVEWDEKLCGRKLITDVERGEKCEKCGSKFINTEKGRTYYCEVQDKLLCFDCVLKEELPIGRVEHEYHNILLIERKKVRV